MSFLSKLNEYVGNKDVPALHADVARAPAELPRIALNLRQAFRQPEVSASMLARVPALDKANLPDRVPSAPAPVPEIAVAIPKAIPDPPPLSGGKPSSASRAKRS